MYWNQDLETIDRPALERLQLSRLRAALERSVRAPFYRTFFETHRVDIDTITTLEHLRDLPFTTKADLRTSYPDGMMAVPRRDVVRLHASSGTTGKSTVIFYTQKDISEWADLIARSMVATGATPDDVFQNMMGFGLFTGGLGLHYGSEKLGALTVPIGGGNTERQLMLIKDFGTTMIACTPSYALNIADYLEKKRPDYDIRKTKLRAGIFGAEPWSEQMRREIESRLGIEAYDIYGLSEVIGPGVSGECSQKSGLHVFEDHFYVEIIDPDTGEVLPEGSKGEIVYTSLTKEACPVIRYRSRDITRLYYDGCACGRTLVKMEKVTGRSDDMLIIRGVNVFPSQIESVLMETEGVEPHYQIIVDRKGALDDIEVKVEVTEKIFSDELKVLEALSRRIADRFRSVLGISAKVTLVEPLAIPRSEGKAVRVIDKRTI